MKIYLSHIGPSHMIEIQMGNGGRKLKLLSLNSFIVLFCARPTVAQGLFDVDLRLRLEKPSIAPGFDSAAEDIGLRARAALIPSFLKDQIAFRIEPKFSSINYINGASSGAQDINSTSFYQLWGEFKTESLSAKLGRQELSFGSERIIGKADWSANGRFFDAARINYFFGLNNISIFYSKINQIRGTINLSGGPNSFNTIHDFYGSYVTFQTAWFDALDFYFLDDTSAQSSNLSLITYGVRFEKRLKYFFGELEATLQNSNANANQTNESQVDVELGPTFDICEGLDVTVEYARASQNYNQLYPSSHEFLGFMDYFSRKNIQDIAGHFRLRFADKLHASADFHQLSALDGTGPIDLGAEIDVTLEKKWRNSSLGGGASYFSPGATNSFYVQTRFDFN